MTSMPNRRQQLGRLLSQRHCDLAQRVQANFPLAHLHLGDMILAQLRLGRKFHLRPPALVSQCSDSRTETRADAGWHTPDVPLNC